MKTILKNQFKAALKQLPVEEQKILEAYWDDHPVIDDDGCCCSAPQIAVISDGDGRWTAYNDGSMFLFNKNVIKGALPSIIQALVIAELAKAYAKALVALEDKPSTPTQLAFPYDEDASLIQENQSALNEE